MEPDDQKTRLLEDHDRVDADIAERDPVDTSLSSIKGIRGEDVRSARLRKAVTLAFLVGVVFGCLGAMVGFLVAKGSAATPESPVAPLRIMVAGDSITQGWEGAHTWRYRLWQWFQENNVDVIFVGPFNGTAPSPSDDNSVVFPMPGPVTRSEDDDLINPPGMDGGYALDVKPEFLNTGSAHFAAWGRQAMQDADVINQMIREYHPDYLLVELGFNDLAWGSFGPDKTLLGMQRLVDNARAASPELRFAIANVPQRTAIGVGNLPLDTQQYNDKLLEAIPSWSSPSSPIELVKFREAYSCDQTACPATFDGIHPNARGEIELAHAFSETLYNKYGIGQQPLSVPSEIPSPPCLTPENSTTHPHPGGIKFMWNSVYGAYGYEVQARREGTEWSTDSVNYTQGRSIDASWTADGAPWEFRARTYCEITIKSSWTPVVSAIVV